MTVVGFYFSSYKQQKLISHSFGGWEYKIKALADLESSTKPASWFTHRAFLL